MGSPVSDTGNIGLPKRTRGAMEKVEIYRRADGRDLEGTRSGLPISDNCRRDRKKLSIGLRRASFRTTKTLDCSTSIDCRSPTAPSPTIWRTGCYAEHAPLSLSVKLQSANAIWLKLSATAPSACTLLPRLASPPDGDCNRSTLLERFPWQQRKPPTGTISCGGSSCKLPLL